MSDNRTRWRIEHDDRTVALGKFDGATTFSLICRIAAQCPGCHIFINDRELVNFDFIRDTFNIRQAYKAANPNQTVIRDASHSHGR